jgi:hypothetical protein
VYSFGAATLYDAMAATSLAAPTVAFATVSEGT